MRTALVVLVLVGCETSAERPPTENHVPAQPAVAPVQRPPGPQPPDPGQRPVVPPGLMHPNGTRTCDLECGDEMALRSAGYRAGRYSPPPGKDEMYEKQCVEACTLFRSNCGSATGDEAFATCVIALLTKGKQQYLCRQLRVAELVSRCSGAFPR